MTRNVGSPSNIFTISPLLSGIQLHHIFSLKMIWKAENVVQLISKATAYSQNWLIGLVQQHSYLHQQCRAFCAQSIVVDVLLYMV